MRIGIVGLGIGGATAAAALIRHGCDVKVFEQAAEIREVGAGIATWPCTIRCYIRLGLGDALAAIGVRGQGGIICDRQGTVLQRWDIDTYDDAPGYTFHRAELLQTVTTLIPKDRLELGKRCVQAEELDDGVRLSFVDGSSAEFDVVIAADGIHSVVHGAVVTPSKPKFSNLAAYRGLVPNTPQIGLTRGLLWTDRTKYFVAFPVSGGRLINFVGVVPTATLPEESWFMQGSKADLVAEYCGWDSRIERIIDSVEHTFRWGLYYRDPLPRMVTRRIALLGDAAHPMLIHQGQGVGQAMEDGFALGVLLKNCEAHMVPKRLQLYEKLRLPRASAVQTQSRRTAQFLHQSFPLEPGETRPAITDTLEWIINYDVEREAQRLLDDASVS